MKSLFAVSLVASSILMTQVAIAGPGKGPDMAAVAQDLGLSEAQLVQCLKDHRPSRQEAQAQKQAWRAGQRPEGAPKPRPEMVSCLQQHNSAITAEQIQSVMQAHRPARP